MRRTAVAFLVVASLVMPAWAAEEAPPPPRRPKVVLVLSGGGARGSAHIGVIKQLEAYHVPVDMVVGTSMGSIVGGLYASGWSIEEIEKQISTIDWGSVFNDKLPRQIKSFRRKSDDARFLVPVKMRFKGYKPYLPPALLGGQNMALLFQAMALDATGEQDFDRFPIPYRAVATDLSTGEVVVLGKGSLSTAMRASMSVPGVFPPVELDGKPLTDGGMAANFPIRIARELGADVVIGVDITTPLRGKEDLGNLLTRLDQMTGLLTTKNRAEDMMAVRPGDVIMIPQLGDISFSDFTKAGEAIKAGEAAAAAEETRLRALSVSDEQWAAYAARHARRSSSDLVVDEVRIHNTGPLADDVVKEFVDVPLGEPLDQKKLVPQLLKLYGTDVYGVIHHDFQRENGKGILTIEAPPKPYGRNSLQFGFNLSDDFEGASGFNLTLSHLMNPVNRKGGEWRNIVQFGKNSLLSTEFYQPLDPAMKWFVSPSVFTRHEQVRQYDAEGHALAEFRGAAASAQFDVGRVFGNWGQVSLGAFRGRAKAKPSVGPATLTGGAQDDGGVAAVFSMDTLDAVTWPRDGVRIFATYRRSFDELGAVLEGDTARIEANAAGTIGRNILFGSVEFASPVGGTPTLTSGISLGGFLRLSGMKDNQLVGPKGGIVRLLYYRELTKFDIGSLTQRMYAGFSLETGSVYAIGDAVTWPSLRYAGSVFVGADTVLGPAYLGYGYSEGGFDSAYLVIGQRF